MPRNGNSQHSTKPKPIAPVNTPVNDHVLMERLTGAQQMQMYLGWNRGKWNKWRREMGKDCIIFRELSGVPPRPHIFTFTSLLQRWLILKTNQGITF